MGKLTLFFALALVASSGAMFVPSFEQSPVLDLIVFFESKCPDSMRFMKDQLKPTFDQLSAYFSVSPIAWGNASFKPDGKGGFNFTCQHGPEECKGNKMFACAMHYISDHHQYVNFTTCAMSLDDPPTALESACADIMTKTVKESTETCRDTVEGDYMLAGNYIVQDGLAPDETWIPWMVVNGEHTADLQDLAEHHLKELVCSKITGEKPAVCGA